jgi:hypothetical protein
LKIMKPTGTVVCHDVVQWHPHPGPPPSKGEGVSCASLSHMKQSHASKHEHNTGKRSHTVRFQSKRATLQIRFGASDVNVGNRISGGIKIKSKITIKTGSLPQSTVTKRKDQSCDNSIMRN